MKDSNLLKHIVSQLSSSVNEALVYKNLIQVYGGDINSTFIIETNKGNFFVKLNDAHYADMFEKEFYGLKLLSAANAIKVPAPFVYGDYQGQIFLVMEAIENGTPSKNFWQNFAHGLAKLHQQTQTYFGLDQDNYIGSLSQSNKKHNSGSNFYAEERIMPLMQKAYQQNKCSLKDVDLAEKFCKNLNDLLPIEQPALLHGDLWSGNFMASKEGEAFIFDPAVYYGHREIDIAMTKLFGGFDNSFYDHYNEAFSLQSGWQQRITLFQLYPLLVHLILFDGHYYNSVISVLKRYA